MSEALDWKRVAARTFERFERFGADASVLVRYSGASEGGEPHLFKEWVPVETERFAALVKRWWAQHGGAEPTPASVDDFLARASEVRDVAEVRVERDGKFWRITGRRFATPRDVGNLTLGSTNQRAE